MWARLPALLDRLGEFELLKRLGAGAQAEVYLAASHDGQLVALKVMLEHLTVRADSRDAFKREARTSSLLKHPNLVEIYDVGETDGRPWISMELVRGWSLSALLKKLRAAQQRLDQDEAAELIRQASLGLHFAHEVKGRDGEPLGLVHRDVSPQNIMVSETGHAKVVDFGLAKATAQSETITATIKGKLRYMPPEQLKSQRLDRRCDVFALGAVLWELACAVQLYPGTSEAEVFQQALYQPQPHPDEVSKGLSRGMVAVLLAATQRDQDKRMGSAKELAEALAPLSSPHARDKLGERIGKLFERLPRTLDEARGTENSSPTLSAATSASVMSESRPAKAKKPGVLAPPPHKPSYLAPQPPQAQGPVPAALPKDFRERRTDTMEAPPPEKLAPEKPAAKKVMELPTSPDRPAAYEKAEKPRPPVPDEVSEVSDVKEPSEVSAKLIGESSEPNTDASFSMGTLVEGDTAANTSPGNTGAYANLDDEQTHASMIAPPSRRTIIIAMSASVGIVALGAIIGAVLRGEPEVDETELRPIGEPAGNSRAPVEDTGSEAGAQSADGGQTAAKVAHGKKSQPLGKQGRVEIDSNVPAMVREKNQDLGMTPLAKTLPPGRHRLSVATPDGTSSTEIDLVVKPGEIVKRSVKLSPR